LPRKSAAACQTNLRIFYSKY